MRPSPRQHHPHRTGRDHAFITTARNGRSDHCHVLSRRSSEKASTQANYLCQPDGPHDEGLLENLPHMLREMSTNEAARKEVVEVLH